MTRLHQRRLHQRGTARYSSLRICATRWCDTSARGAMARCESPVACAAFMAARHSASLAERRAEARRRRLVAFTKHRRQVRNCLALGAKILRDVSARAVAVVVSDVPVPVVVLDTAVAVAAQDGAIGMGRLAFSGRGVLADFVTTVAGDVTTGGDSAETDCVGGLHGPQYV